MGQESTPQPPPPQRVGDLEVFFEIALDMLCISNEDGYFKRLNPAFSEALGWSMEELLSHPFMFFVHPDDAESTLNEVQKQMAAGEKVLHFENRYRHKDGSYRVLAWRSVPQPNGYMYAVARDVSDQRLQEKELREKNSDLEQFSRAAAHDLRAPLRAIGSYAQILHQDHGSDLPESAKEDLERIRVNVDKMSRMIDGLLRFSRAGAQELDKAEVDVRAMVGEIVSDLQEQNPHRSLEFRVGELPRIHADYEMAKIVFSNLLSNAVKYTRLRKCAVIEVDFLAGHKPPCFVVRDNGAGFDMDHVDKLFRVFERIHPVAAYEGSGIGLATVHRILQRHGGTIWAEGRVDEGAAFYFTI